MRSVPAYLRATPSIGGRLADLLDADDLVREVTDGRAGIVTAEEESQLDAILAQATAAIRDARRRWELERVDGKFR